MPNVGYASLQIIPSVRGIGAEIREQIGAPIAAAGDAAGEGFAKRMLKGMSVAALAGAAGVGALIAKGVTGAMEQEQIAGKLGAQLGATGPEAARYGKIAGGLYASAVTDDIEGAADAIRATMSAGLLPPQATNDQIASIATQVHDLSDTFELDLGQAANAVGQIMKTGLAPDAQSALDTITRGLQVMGPRADDLGDTFNEYSVIFQRLGLSAQAATGLLSQGMKAGARDTDVVADALKEFTLEGVQGSQKIVDGFKAIGLNSDQMVKMISSGGGQATQALQMTLDRLRAMEDPVKRDAAATSLFGTKSEDLQKSLLALDPSTAVAALGDVAGAAGRMGDSLRDNASTRIEEFKRGIEQGLTNVVGGALLPVLERGASALAGRFGPALSTAASWAKNEALPAVASFARTVADDLVPALSSGASWLADHLGAAAGSAGRFLREDLLPAAGAAAAMVRDEFGPVLGNVAGVLRDDAVPAAQTVGRVLRDDVAPAVGAAAEVAGKTLVPVLGSVARVLTGDLVPALADSARWVRDNGTVIEVTAGVVAAVLLPALITSAVGWAQSGIAATVSGGQQVAAWTMAKVAAVQGAATSLVASYQTVGGWVAAGASAVVSGVQQVGAWIATGARAAWGMALQIAASAAVVGGWILMGGQSLVQAARMAAAWVIAMGPIGWITVAVIAIVALIIAYWDEIKAATVAAWQWVVDKVKWAGQFMIDIFMNFTLVGLLIKHWQSIKQGAVDGWNAVVDWVKQIPGWLYSAFLNFTLIGLLIQHWQAVKQGAVDGWNSVLSWIKGVPQSIADTFSGLGSLLVEQGGDLIRGLWSGIQRMGSWLRDRLVGWAKDMIPGPIASALGINSPSTVMRDRIGRWIPAGIITGIQQGAPDLEAVMADLVVPPTIPDWMLQSAAPVPVGAAAAAYSPAPAGPQAAGPGALVQIDTYVEADGGDPRRTAAELYTLTRARG
ncbi:phage tail tape measure protein [Kitasatospora cineracea]|uniref:phage tail tape measure protein n=1 Tax=Kitasatospora cineracea TaxID=88074 RepID=UPI003437B55E